MISLSNNLVYVPLSEQSGETLVYHRLFGTPTTVSNDLLARLKNTTEVEHLRMTDPSVFAELLEASVVEDPFEARRRFNDTTSRHAQRAAKGNAVRQLDLVVSQLCNLGCPHCIYYSGNARPGKAKNARMTASLATRAWTFYLELARKNAVDELSVHFGGAEPLTNWKLVEHCLATFPDSLRARERIRWSMNTNVVGVTAHIAEVLAQYAVEIHTSLDGPKEANDAVRPDLRGHGTFDRIVKKIELLRRSNVLVADVSTTLTSANFHRVDRHFVEWLETFGITAFGIDIDLVGSQGISVAEAVDKLLDIYWACARRGIECTGTWMTPFLNIVNRDTRHEHVAFCGAIKGVNISVLPDGETTLCSYMSTRLGSIDELQFGEDSQWADVISARQPGVDPHCVGCILETQCAGQCHVTREEAQRCDSSALIDRMCVFLRAVTTEMLRSYAQGGQCTSPTPAPGRRLP